MKSYIEQAAATFRRVLREQLTGGFVGVVLAPERPQRYVARFERTGSIGYWSVYRKSDGMTFGVGGTLEAAIKCAKGHPYAQR